MENTIYCISFVRVTTRNNNIYLNSNIDLFIELTILYIFVLHFYFKCIYL